VEIGRCDPLKHESEPLQTSERVTKVVVRLVGLIVLAMIIPIVPFLLGGESLERVLEEWIKSELPVSFQLVAVMITLMADIFLPIPSSAVITYAGATCGIIPASLAAWTGLSLGGVVGYELSRAWGSRLINRLTGEVDRLQMQKLVLLYGPLAVVLSRPLPILGETTVLIVGSLKMRRFAFYFSLVISNLAVSLVYAGFGNWFSDPDLLPWVLAMSLIIPVLLTFAVRLFFGPKEKNRI